MTRAMSLSRLGRFFIPCLAFLLVLFISHLFASETILGDDATETREAIVVGPFKLGDWLGESKVEMRSGFDSEPFIPGRNELIKSLNECHAYVSDQRIVVKGKAPQFGQPKLMVTGQLHHVFEIKKGRYVIQVAGLKASPNQTDYSTKPVVRRVLVSVRVEAIESDGAISLNSTIHFGPEKLIGYDLNGAAK